MHLCVWRKLSGHHPQDVGGVTQVIEVRLRTATVYDEEGEEEGEEEEEEEKEGEEEGNLAKLNPLITE